MCCVIPLNHSTISSLPLLSIVMPRGTVRLSATLTAVQPLASLYLYSGAGTPGQDDSNLAEWAIELGKTQYVSHS